MLELAGPDAMACSKVWQSQDAAATEKIHRYCLVAFLLGAAPGALWYFTSKRATTVTPWNPLWTTAKRLGSPVGARSGLHREFEGGYVDLNVSLHDATIALY